ncbi:MAG: altronate dehydratase [Planctomycetaceae bacterium]|nr:altronate dehydratase [Planctomycetaceae bacterium]MDG1808308.1 altronate dehydratase family protein [Pirellulaceae bacterium]MDG2104306.1 altronate dehydratase family protein [Pirellulaceae bacterium]
MRKTLIVHPEDHMVVALTDLPAGSQIEVDGSQIQLANQVKAKHKFTRWPCRAGDYLKMYGLVVGQALRDLTAGERLDTTNLKHAVADIAAANQQKSWEAPEFERWREARFQGYARPDGRFGTRNFWIVVPLVFCQNRNVDVLREALWDQLGYGSRNRFSNMTRRLVELHAEGTAPELIRETAFHVDPYVNDAKPLFPHVDGIKFLTHDGGCGGLYEDARTLCGLLAGYINHPNVAGATVLSLGCQKSQIATLEAELHQRNAHFQKPLYILEQQQEGSESTLLEKALRFTFAGVAEADQQRRQAAPLSHLNLGVECGGSDGFSGISANPAIGYCSDLLVGQGGSVILSEFPELSGCENDLVSRSKDAVVSERFLQIMRDYESRAQQDGGGFDQNPSPGNVADGLITDAMKSAGAARKGGTSPIVDVLDYPEPVVHPGLNLLCTPGGDVESTTAMAGSGATIQLFSTGLGTPTGNPISPVLKISSNSELPQRMPDIIDWDAGSIISGQQTIEEVGRAIWELVIKTASGEYHCKAEQLGQNDFIPWKRGVSI